MDSNLIVMLTHNDYTVKNAKEVFEACADLPVQYWGFKNVGLDIDGMKELISLMKKANKTTVLEVVTYTEESCLENVKFAHELGIDYFTGSQFFMSAWEYIKNTDMQYFPFIGDVSGSPVTLRGSIEDIVAQAKKVEELGVHGVDITSYRYVDGDPVELTKALVNAISNKVVIAGSIGDEERIRIVNDINPFAYTMGSALFEKNFVKDGSFRENLGKVIEIMSKIK